MPRRVVWPATVREQMRHLPPSIKRDISAATKQLDSRWRTHVKRLDTEGERYTLRVGGYRVILVRASAPETYEVEHLGPRTTVYDAYPRLSEADC